MMRRAENGTPATENDDQWFQTMRVLFTYHAQLFAADRFSIAISLR
jgi:hypothetical protein